MASFDVETTSDGLFEVLITVNRTAKVVKGGRVFRFNALVVVGDKCGKVGYGRGKARELPEAIRKAMENGRRNMRHIPIKDKTLWYPVTARFGATKVIMLPAAEGTGVIAGGAMRAVFNVLGVENVLAKCIGSTNPINLLYATMKGLTGMVEPRYIARKRGKTLAEIYPNALIDDVEADVANRDVEPQTETEEGA